MSSPNEKKQDLGVVATYKCQRQTGKMRLIGTRMATYLDMKRKNGGGSKLTPYESDDERAESPALDLGKKGQVSSKEAPDLDVVKGDGSETPSATLSPEKTTSKVVVVGRSTQILSGRKRERAESPDDGAVDMGGVSNPST